MNQNTILPGANTGRDDCFSRESILEEDFCLEECLAAAEAGDQIGRASCRERV